ncbi:putative Saccharopine dehydrogenase, partial [Pisolithus albus]
YETGDRDLIVLRHKFVEILTSTLEKYGSPGGHSAMAVAVGVPCGIATQLVLDGVINTPGVLAPHTKEICEPIRATLESEGLGLIKRVL